MIVTLFKTDKQGQIYYYTIHDRQKDLYTPHCFTARWGRMVNGGREKYYSFETRSAMDLKLRQIFRQRCRQGYRVLYTFSRDKKEKELFQTMDKKRRIS